MSNQSIDELWERVKNDRSRGSRELLHYTLQELSDLLVDPLPVQDPKREIPRRLRDVRPEMALFSTAAACLFNRCENGSREELRRVIEAFENRLSRSVKRLQSVFDARIQEAQEVLLFSRSGTVMTLLRGTPGTFEALHVLESHPGDEGLSVANDLRDEFPVRFWYDMELPAVLEECDVALIGADSFDRSGRVLNKTGSRALAELAEVTDLLVVTELLKVSPRSLEDGMAPVVDSPGSLASELRRGHPLFEVVPAGGIDGYITNEGYFEDVDELLESCEDLLDAHRVFSDALGESE